MTASEYRKLFGKDPPPIPAQHTEEGDESLMTLEQLFQSRCGECVNCEKDDCGQCSSCLSNRTSGREAVCLQKVSSINEDSCTWLRRPNSSTTVNSLPV